MLLELWPGFFNHFQLYHHHDRDIKDYPYFLDKRTGFKKQRTNLV